MYDKDLTDNGKPLESMRRLPWRLRVIYPILVVVNVVIFLVAHLSISTTVRLQGWAPFNLITNKDVTNQNIVTALEGFYEAHAWLFFFAVGLMSGLWPYIKVLSSCLLVYWQARGTITRKTCHDRLLTLSMFGKWSFVDINLLCLNVIIFDISTADYTLRLFFKLRIDIFWMLHFAVVLFILGVVLSTVLTHWAIEEMAPTADEKTSLGDVEEMREIEDEVEPYTGSASCDGLLSILLACCALCILVAAAFIPLIKVEREGFLGNLIPIDSSRGLDRDLSLSIFSVMRMLLFLADFRVQPLLHVLAAVWLLASFLFPVFELIALCLNPQVWRWKWTQSLGHWTLSCAQLARSFSCVEVLLVSVVITRLELPTVVQHQLTTECASLKDIYEGGWILDLAGLGFAADANCFALGGGFDLGFYLLLAVVALRFSAWRLARAQSPRRATRTFVV